MFIIWTSCKDKKATETLLKPTLLKYDIKDHLTRIHEPGLVVEPDDGVVLVLGSQLLKVLQGEGVMKKGRAIASLRSKIHDHKEGHYVISYDPMVKNTDYSLYMNLKWDVELACRKYKTGETLPKMGQYKIVDNFNNVWNAINCRMGAQRDYVPVSIDLETIGFDPWAAGKYIVSVFITFEDGEAYGMYLNDSKGKLTLTQELWLKFILNHPRVRVCGANFKFDLLWMWVQWGIECSNFTFDTLLVGSLIDENMSNSANSHAKVYTSSGGYDEIFNEKFDKSKMNEVPLEDLIPYAGGDTDTCLQVYKVLRQMIFKDPELTNFYRTILHPASRVFELMERTGCLVDLQYYNELEIKLAKEADRLLKRCLGKIPKIILKDVKDPNKLTPNILKEFMFGERGLGLLPKMFTPKAKTADWKGASTAGEHFDMFSNNKKAKPFITDYKDLQQTNKTLQTYVIGFLKHLRTDGRLHPSYFLFHGQNFQEKGGTVTGRCLAEGSKVLTQAHGYIPIEEVRVGDLAMTHDGKWLPVLETFDNGEKEVIKIQLVKGNILTCTPNHPILTSMGWVKAVDLNSNHKVLTYEESQKPKGI